MAIKEYQQNVLASAYHNGSEEFKREVDKKLDEMSGSITGKMLKDMIFGEKVEK